MDNEQKLIEAAQAVIGADDHVAAAGWFEPWSRQYMDAGLAGLGGKGGGTGSLVLDGVFAAASAAGAGYEMHKSGNMPAAIVLAVTATNLYAFEGNLAMSTGSVGALWKKWALAAINVHAHKTLYVVSVTVEETEPDGHSYHLIGSKLHVASSKAVMNALLNA